MPLTHSNQQNVKTALITGAGSGIGYATVEKFIHEGWNVIALGRNQSLLDQLKKRFGEAKILTVKCDLTLSNEINEAAKLISESKFGSSLFALINNAGIFARRSFKDSELSLWESIFNTNLFGAIRLTQAVLPLLEKNVGAIVNVSSTLGLRPVEATSAYSASKAAMINWTESLAIEAASNGIRVNCVCPGIIDTPIHDFHNQSKEEKMKLGHLQPLQRIGRPEDVAYSIWTLCAPGSEWITGTTLKVDGGIHLV